MSVSVVAVGLVTEPFPVKVGVKQGCRINDSGRRVNLVERISLLLLCGGSSVRLPLQLAPDDEALWLIRMAPNVSVAGIPC